MRTPWPPHGLETKNACPLCQEQARTLLFDQVEDLIFPQTPGAWTLWACDACQTIYPDPRPDEQTIGLAYASYYTHSDSDQSPSAFKRLRTAIDRAAQSWLYRLMQANANSGLSALFPASLFPATLTTKYASRFRHLPPARHPGQRVLDSGCGSGAFLPVAQSLGYIAIGSDTDPQAVESGRKQGLDIRLDGLPRSTFPDRHFAHITLNHVIEHVHDVHASLRELHRLLEPGGVLWMATPNREGSGLDEFGRNWRGLETPRHLQLFSRTTMQQALDKAGFETIAFHPHPPCGKFFTQQSLAMAANIPPYDPAAAQLWTSQAKAIAAQLNRDAARDMRKADIMIVTAKKPE